MFAVPIFWGLQDDLQGIEKKQKKVIFFIVESEISFRFAPANINSTHVQGNFGKAFNIERFGVVLKKGQLVRF